MLQYLVGVLVAISRRCFGLMYEWLAETQCSYITFITHVLICIPLFLTLSLHAHSLQNLAGAQAELRESRLQQEAQANQAALEKGAFVLS